MEPDNILIRNSPNIGEGITPQINKPNPVLNKDLAMRSLTKTSMKKFFRFLILANKRLRKQHLPLSAPHVSIRSIKTELNDIKEKIDKTSSKKLSRRETISSKISQHLSDHAKKRHKIIINLDEDNMGNASKKPFEGVVIRKKGSDDEKDKIMITKELLEKIDKFGKKNIKKEESREIIKEITKPKKELSKELLLKIDKFGKRDIVRNTVKKTGQEEQPKLQMHADPEFEKKSREILELKSVIFDLERKHKEIVERNEHHPLLLKRLEEKINFLKRRISDIENGRQNNQREAQ